MGTSSSAIFTGSSNFAQDFQSVIDRSVAIASLPIEQLTNDKTALTNQANDLSSLDTKFTALQSAIDALGNSGSSFTAQSSNPATVSATAAAGAAEGSFTVEVVGLGSYTTTMSKGALTAIADPSTQNISSSSTYTLRVNGQSFTINPSSNSLDSLVQAINATPGANVRASIVNVGPASAPSYRLTVQGTKLNADTIQLNDGSTDLLDTLATGENASYKINGMSTAIQTDSRTIVLAPGVTAQLLQQSPTGQPTTIDVSVNSGGIGDALSSLADAYNAVIDLLNQQHGKDGGSLQGLSIVNSLTNSLRDMSLYSAGSGSIQSLTDLGLELGRDGKLSFDAATFQAATASGTAAIASFLGNAASGGFLKNASDDLKAVEDPSSGTLQNAIQSTQDRITSTDQQIQTNQDRVDQLRQNLQEQMAAADALVASLE